MITMNDVPLKYRTTFRGEYNAAINFCVECHEYFDSEIDKNIGFAELNGYVVLIYECQKCFTIQYHHVKTFDMLETLLEIMKYKEKRK